ncbi:hypothetical protein JCM1841_006276 [Sporobolomyces salmonicolor]
MCATEECGPAPLPCLQETNSRTPSPSYPSQNRPRTVLPSLSSLSLPPIAATALAESDHHGSPPTVTLHHPRPTYPARRLSQRPLLPVPVSRVQLSPEAYARAYEVLRARWQGCGQEIVEDAWERQREAKKRRHSDEATHAVRALHERNVAARSKRIKLEPTESQPSSNEIAFFDNPAPALATDPEVDADIHPTSSSSVPLSEAQRLSSPTPHTRSSSPTSSASVPSTPHQRERSSSHRVSLPAPPHPTPTASSRSSPDTFARQLPPLPTSRSTLHLSSTSAARSDALLQVVQSFEAVLACRAEGWRMLASRRDVNPPRP